MPDMYDVYQGIRSLDDDGSIPETRLADADAARNLVTQLIYADNAVRAEKRARVKGLVDGNPPYKKSALRAAGRADACNVNWRKAEAFLNNALGAFYDIFAEATTYATVTTGFGTEQQRPIWSDIITEEFDRLMREDRLFDYEMQLSQCEMVLYGCGPLVFSDKLDWRCHAVRNMNCLVFENTKSDVTLWELGVIRRSYQAHELYEFIRDPQAATAVGWNVPATRLAIMHAHPKIQDGGIYLNWEWYQQQLKNGSFYYSMQAKTIEVAHLFFKEFPKAGEVEGKITHCVVLERVAYEGKTEYLFQSIGRFDNWEEVIHPMYYDRGGGGEHHSVTGMGVKMYAAIEYQNRLLCNLADKAFAPKVLLKPTTADVKQKLALANFGDFGVLPAGMEVQQTGLAGLMQDGLTLNNEIDQIIVSNLSQYRTQIDEKQGNPITAAEANIRASQQSALGKTQLNRYQTQQDSLYAEIYRRASNINLDECNPGGKQALAFQQRCFDKGVPKEALATVQSVVATRISGEGSLYLRQQQLQFLMGMVSMLPEQGRANLISDTIAARAGRSFVKRYYDVSPDAQKPTDQHAFAMSQVADMKVGVAPVITDTQNPVIYAQTFLQAGAQAAQSVQKGAKPEEVLAFLELIGQAAHAHLERIKPDPTRAGVYKLLFPQWQQLATFTDSLVKHVQEQQQKAQEAAQQAQAAQAPPVDPKAAMAAASGLSKMQLDRAKEQQAMVHKEQKHRQDLALQDATTAAKIRADAQIAKAKAATGQED